MIPDSLWAPGLRDWETDGANLKDEVMDVGKGGVEGRTVVATSIQWRVDQRERRRREKDVPRVMKGLKSLRLEWEAKEKMKQQAEETTAVP